MSQPENAKDGVVQTHEDLIGNDGPFDDDYDPSDYDLEFMAQLAANDLKANQETQEVNSFMKIRFPCLIKIYVTFNIYIHWKSPFHWNGNFQICFYASP